MDEDRSTANGMTVALGRRALVAMIAVNGLVAYLVAQFSVARVEHVHLGLGTLWTAGALGFATAGVAVAFLWSASGREPARWLPVAGLLLAAGACLALGRAQVGVHNAELVRTLIPLQSETIRACEAAAVTAPDLIEYCGRLVVEREREIWELQRILRRY